MTEPLAGHLQIHSHLSLEVDGQRIQLEGNGQDLVLSAPDAAGLTRQIGITAAAFAGNAPTSRRLVRRLADAANRRGIRITVNGRTGPIAAIGRDVDVWVMGWLAGTRHVQIKPGRETLATLAALLRR